MMPVAAPIVMVCTYFVARELGGPLGRRGAHTRDVVRLESVGDGYFR